MQDTVSVLFVCMGNICRSPTAEGVFIRHVEDAGLASRIKVDSAGTHAYHVGDPPDARAQRTATARGYDLSRLRARRAVASDFTTFDYVVAMDADNRAHLEEICPSGLEDRLSLFLEHAPDTGVVEVPDPYYGGPKGFEYVLDLIEAASQGLLTKIRHSHGI